MKAWFLSLAPRERVTVAGGAGVALLVLVYLLAIEPAIEALAQRQERVATLERQVDRMQEAANEVRSLRASGQGNAVGSSDQAPSLAVESVLAGSGLPQPDSLKSDGDAGARLEFDQVPFDPLVQVLGRLRSEHGLVVTRADITREAEGRVDARVTLERKP